MFPVLFCVVSPDGTTAARKTNIVVKTRCETVRDCGEAFVCGVADNLDTEAAKMTSLQGI